MREIEALIVRMAHDNPTWGYLRIKGALQNLGHRVARTTIANILARHGIEPAPASYPNIQTTSKVTREFKTQTQILPLYLASDVVSK